MLYFKRFFSFYVLYVLYEYVNYLRNGVQARKLHLNDQAISNNYRTEKMSYLKSNQLITLNINYTKRMSMYNREYKQMFVNCHYKVGWVDFS